MIAAPAATQAAVAGVEEPVAASAGEAAASSAHAAAGAASRAGKASGCLDLSTPLRSVPRGTTRVSRAAARFRAVPSIANELSSRGGKD